MSGQIQVGQTLSGTGVTAGTTIVAQLTNTDANGIPGRAGTYQTSLSTTSSSNSLTTAGAPQNATYGVICAYAQAINYRDDGTAPTASVPGGGQGIPGWPVRPVQWNVFKSSVHSTDQRRVGGDFVLSMKRELAIAVLFAALAALGAAAALASPMIPTSQPPGPMMPALGGPIIPGFVSGGAPPPPTCSNALDFTKACNSQYVGVF